MAFQKTNKTKLPILQVNSQNIQGVEVTNADDINTVGDQDSHTSNIQSALSFASMNASEVDLQEGMFYNKHLGTGGGTKIRHLRKSSTIDGNLMLSSVRGEKLNLKKCLDRTNFFSGLDGDLKIKFMNIFEQE